MRADGFHGFLAARTGVPALYSWRGPGAGAGNRPAADRPNPDRENRPPARNRSRFDALNHRPVDALNDRPVDALNDRPVDAFNDRPVDANNHIPGYLIRACLLATVCLPVLSVAADASVLSSLDQLGTNCTRKVAAPWDPVDLGQNALGAVDITVTLNAPYSFDIAEANERLAVAVGPSEDLTNAIEDQAIGFTGINTAVDSLNLGGFDHGVTCAFCSSGNASSYFTATTGSHWLTPSEIEVVNVDRYFVAPVIVKHANVGIAASSALVSVPAMLVVLGVALPGLVAIQWVRLRRRGESFAG